MNGYSLVGTASANQLMEYVGGLKIARVDVAYLRELAGVVDSFTAASLGLAVMVDHIGKRGASFMTNPSSSDSTGSIQSDMAGGGGSATQESPSSSLSSSSPPPPDQPAPKKSPTNAGGNKGKAVGVHVLSDAVREAVDLEWKVAVRKIVYDTLVGGFSVVVRKHTTDGHAYPFVLDRSMYEVLQITDETTFDVYYIAVRTDEYRRRFNITAKYVVIEDAHVVMVNEPDNETGRARSPVSAAYKEIMQANTCDASLSQSLYHSMNPQVTVDRANSDPESTLYGSKNPGIGSIELTDLVRIDSKQMRADRSSSLKMHQRDAEKEVAKAAAVGYQRAAAINSRARLYNEGSRMDLATMYKLNTPALAAIQMPIGERFNQLETRPPTPVALDYCSTLEHRILTRIGVSPQLVGIEKSNFASNTDLAFGMFNNAAERYRSEIQPALAHLFEFVYGLRSTDITLHEDGSVVIETEKDRQFGERHDDFSDDDDDDDSEYYHLTPTHRYSQKRRKTEKITQHSDPIEDRTRRLLQSLKGRITADLGCTPLAEIAQLYEAYKYHVIDHRRLKEKVAAQLNIPAHEIMEDDYTYEDLMHLNSAKDDDGGGGGKTGADKEPDSVTRQSVSVGTGRKTTDSARKTSISH